MKNPEISWEIETATFRLLAQCLIQLRHSVPHCMYINTLYHVNYSLGMAARVVLCIDRS